METIGDRIRNKRKESGMTQLELANKLNITDKAISKWEQNEGNPDISILPKIAEIFNVSLDYLLTGKEPDKEVLIISKMELCAKNDDPSMLKEIFSDRDENGKCLMDHIIQYKSKKVLTSLIDECKTEFDYLRLFHVSKINKKEIIKIILLCISIDRERIVFKSIFHDEIKNCNEFKNVLHNNNSQNREIAEDYQNVFKLLVKEYKNLTENQRQYYFGLKENENTTCWFDAYSYFLEYAFIYNNKELYELLLNQIEIYNSWVKDSIKILKEKYRNPYDFNNHFDSSKYKNVVLLESTYKYLIWNNKYKFAYRVNIHLEKPHLRREIELLEVENDMNISETDKIKFRCIDNFMIVSNEIEKLDNLEKAKNLLDNNYVNYYEMVFKLLQKDKKKLYKFFIDNELLEFSKLLFNGEINELLEKTWIYFNYDAKGELCLKQTIIVTDDSYNLKRSDRFVMSSDLRRLCNDLTSEAKKLEDNKIINYFENHKNNIYDKIKKNVCEKEKEKKDKLAKLEAIKGLNVEYFEKLISENDNEMFIIKLSSLFDAIIRYDYKCNSDDFYKRMNEFFEKGPKSRNCDDGRGYMVLDEKYEDEFVKPWEENRDLMNKLRIKRNNIVHPECKDDCELDERELKSCLEFVFKINGGKMFNE